MGARFFTPLDNIIFKTLTGSRLYGTHTSKSDHDYVSICIAPIEQYLSNDGFNQTQHQSKKEDYTIYDIKKAVKLMADNNPNMIELLYIPYRYISISTPYWKKLHDHMDGLYETSSLQKRANYNLIDELMIGIIKEYNE